MAETYAVNQGYYVYRYTWYGGAQELTFKDPFDAVMTVIRHVPKISVLEKRCENCKIMLQACGHFGHHNNHCLIVTIEYVHRRENHKLS